MNDWEDSNESEGIKNMRKQIKEQGKLLKEQAELIAQFNTQNRGAAIANALTSRGLDSRVAKFYPADLGTDDESVNKWFTENKDFFGPAQPVATPETQDTTLSDVERRGYEAMQAMEAYDSRIVQDFKSQIDQIKMDGPYDGEKASAELMALLKANGVNIASM